VGLVFFSIGLIAHQSEVLANACARVANGAMSRHHSRDPVRRYKARILTVHLRGGVQSE
jgi:hypothetical protein